MTDPGRMAFSLVRGGYGAVLLCAPGTAVRLSGAGPASPRALAVTRVLGARHLIQAAVTAAAPNAAVLTVGAQVDCAHAASMLAVAAASRPLRRAGLGDGLIATVLAVTGLAVAGTAGARPRRHADGATAPSPRRAGAGTARTPRRHAGTARPPLPGGRPLVTPG